MKGVCMKILNLSKPWYDESIAILSDWYCHDAKADEVIGVIADLVKVDLKKFPNLKFVASCTTGLDHIDADYCLEKGIIIISLWGETEFLENVWATAEHTWALILSLIRKVPWAFEDVKAGNWDREAWQGTELRGKTLGIVGHGRVGRQVENIAKAFGMPVYISDPKHFIFYPFEYMLGRSDIVTVHVPLTDETRGMFGEREFRLMKSTAYFVNTSRGGVVDESALLDALEHGWIAGAALDVVCNEPNINPGLLEYAGTNSRLILSPHLGGNTAESRKNTQRFMTEKIRKFIGGG